MGIEVAVADLGPTRRGAYYDDLDLIVVSDRLSMPQFVTTLAHEIGHAIRCDRESTPVTERSADEKGASLIITPDEYAEAERIAGEHPTAIAHELGDVTGRLVLAWQRWWEKAGGVLDGLGREAA